MAGHVQRGDASSLCISFHPAYRLLGEGGWCSLPKCLTDGTSSQRPRGTEGTGAGAPWGTEPGEPSFPRDGYGSKQVNNMQIPVETLTGTPVQTGTTFSP